MNIKILSFVGIGVVLIFVFVIVLLSKNVVNLPAIFLGAKHTDLTQDEPNTKKQTSKLSESASSSGANSENNQTENRPEAKSLSLLIQEYNNARDQLIEQWEQDSDSPYTSETFTSYIKDFVASCEALGSTGQEQAIELLRKEFDPELWSQRLSSHNEKGLTSAKIADSYFRHYIIKGLLSAAVKKPELFEEINGYSDEYLRETKDDVIAWFPEFKEKYFLQHPEEVPEKGYIILPTPESGPVEYYKFIFLMEKIKNFYKKHNKLPNRLLELTIPHGGEYVYLPNDSFKTQKDALLNYFHYQTENHDICLLLSVGPNGKQDIDPSRILQNPMQGYYGLEPGFSSPSQKFMQIFPSYQDDLVSIGVIRYPTNKR